MDPPTVTRPTTRAKNANQHPGRVGQTRKRHTKAEIERDNALLQQEKEAEAQKKNEGIARVAQLEDKMAIDDTKTGGAHPRNNHSDLISLCFSCRTNDPKKDLRKGATRRGDEQVADNGIELPSRKQLLKKAGATQPASRGPIARGSLRPADEVAKQKRKHLGTKDEIPIHRPGKIRILRCDLKVHDIGLDRSTRYKRDIR
jgi:hypothetical protein